MVALLLLFGFGFRLSIFANAEADDVVDCKSCWCCCCCCCGMMILGDDDEEMFPGFEKWVVVGLGVVMLLF